MGTAPACGLISAKTTRCVQADSSEGGEGALEGAGDREETPEMGWEPAEKGRCSSGLQGAMRGSTLFHPGDSGGRKPKRAPSRPERAVPSQGPALGAYACESHPRGAGSRELGFLNSLCAGCPGTAVSDPQLWSRCSQALAGMGGPGELRMGVPGRQTHTRGRKTRAGGRKKGREGAGPRNQQSQGSCRVPAPKNSGAVNSRHKSGLVFSQGEEAGEVMSADNRRKS